MIPYDTILADFTRLFGSETLGFLVENLYPSAIFRLIMFAAAITMFIFTAWSLHRGKLHQYVTIFWITWIAMLPVPQKPLFYVFIKNASSLFVYQLEKTTYNLFTKFGTNNSYPPGFVAETIIKAATTKITNPGISKAITTIIDNCVPFGNITDQNGISRPINASDLFRVKVSGSLIDADSFEFPFSTTLLKNRYLDLEEGKTDCHSFLITTLSRLYSHLRKKDITSTNGKLFVGPKNGEFNQRWIDKWSNSASPKAEFGKTALNLAAASAIQAQILNNYFGADLKFTGSNIRDGSTTPLIEMQKKAMGELNPTKLVFNFKNLPNSLMRSFNTDHFFSNANKLIELNERHINLPYYISCIIVFLTIIFAFVIITPFISGSWKYLAFWSTAYIMTLIIPWILMILRSICNIILIHSLNIDKYAKNLSSDPSYLKTGIDFSAVSNMLEDSSRFISVYLDTENALCGSILLIIPFVSWAAGGATSKAGAFLSGSAYSAIQNKLLNKAGQGASLAKDVMLMKFAPNSQAGMVATNNFASKAKGMTSIERGHQANKDFLKNLRS